MSAREVAEFGGLAEAMRDAVTAARLPVRLTA